MDQDETNHDEDKPSVYDFVGESQGSGIFIDDRAKKRGKYIYELVYEFFCSLPPEKYHEVWHKKKKKLRPKILKIVSDYYADCDHERRINRPRVRTDVKALRQSAASMLRTLRRLQLDARQTVNNQAKPHLQRKKIAEHNLIQHTIDTIKIINLSTRPIAKETNSRVGGIAMRNVCLRSWSLWEQLTNRTFSRNYELLKFVNIDGSHDHLLDFTKPEHQFVHLIMYSIDNNITSNRVRSILNVAAREQSKRERSKKRMVV